MWYTVNYSVISVTRIVFGIYPYINSVSYPPTCIILSMLKHDGQPTNYYPQRLALTKLIYIGLPYSMNHEKQVRSLSSKAIGSDSRETIAYMPSLTHCA